jgi:hypothetical protein
MAIRRPAAKELHQGLSLFAAEIWLQFILKPFSGSSLPLCNQVARFNCRCPGNPISAPLSRPHGRLGFGMHNVLCKPLQNAQIRRKVGIVAIYAHLKTFISLFARLPLNI